MLYLHFEAMVRLILTIVANVKRGWGLGQSGDQPSIRPKRPADLRQSHVFPRLYPRIYPILSPGIIWFRNPTSLITRVWEALTLGLL